MFYLTRRIPITIQPFTRRLSTTSQEAYLEPSTIPGVTCLVLNKPKTYNAISRLMLRNIRESLEAVRQDPSTRLLILRSASPRMFCAGADLAERRSMTPRDVHLFLSTGRETLGVLEELECPTIAAIDGPALGGGLELALVCDFRIARNEAKNIGLPETALGIIPGFGGTQRLARLLGITKAKELVFTARKMSAREAHAYGVVDHLSEAGQTGYERSLLLAEEIVKNAPLALQAAKRSISRSPELSLSSGLDFERACYEPLLGSKDRLEGLEAFKEGRRPVYKGE
ncbi:ClpP/crotonase [Dacryopinax primogenitus]|uniref:ClpP/crotonase n=1 Tax=Dacryopinax primogenitus (strain DJM 731) TaxID=1858805 RepID=M5GC40_DACPD|nr:ClpP/crotonase [Dacryopinax primogenitus]EJU06589.1 ClpP/crotonase [Dacryopinax primogenitus]